jgi:STE24 endopeptidase
VSHPLFYRRLLVALIVIILLSPLPYWLTGIGQSASGLSAKVGRLPDGAWVSSPRAEALHTLALPMRIERLLLYPLLLLAFQLSGGALALRRRLGWGSAGSSERVSALGLLTVLLFVLILDLSLALLYLPFDFYGSFVVGRQFGLSTQTAEGWAVDWAMNLLIDLVTDGVLWTGLYALIRLLSRRWPIPAGAALVVLAASFTLLSPILITPLFYQVRPLEDPALRARVQSLSDRVGMRVEAVDVIDASAKTTGANAYFTGFGGAQRIVLYDTLLANHTPDEVEVTLAHEMGHWYYRHVLLGLLGAGAAGWIGLFLLRELLKRTWQPLGLSGAGDVAGLPFLLAVVAVVTLISLPVQNGVSRYAEAQADRFSLDVSRKPEAYVTSFVKLAEENLAAVDAPSWEKLLFYDHPSIAERIRMAEPSRGK